MTKFLPALLLAATATLTGCSQLPSKSGSFDPAEARYVEATLLVDQDLNGTQVITTVALQHLTAAQAEAAMRKQLPEGVLVARTGNTSSVVLQGPDQGVVAAIKTLKKLDAK